MFRAILIFLALIIYGVAASQNPSPSPAKTVQPQQSQSTTGQQQRATDQNVTIKSPVEVKLLNTGKTPEETKQDAEDRKDKSSSDWWLVGLTAVIGVLAFLQLLAFIAQAVYMRKTFAATEDTAKKNCGRISAA